MSEVKDLKENQKQFIDAVVALGNLESLDKTNKVIIGNIFIRYSEPLAEIADVLEEIKAEANSYSDLTAYADDYSWVIPERSEDA